MQVPVHLPDLGADEVRLSVWFAAVGEEVYEGDRLVEVLTGSATFDVSAPVSGRLVEQRVLADDPVLPGQLLGIVEVDFS